MCVGCRARKPKKELLRFVVRDGRLYFDPYYKAEGRGMSLCPARSCFKGALKKSVLERALRCELEEVPTPERLREQVLASLERAIVDTLRIGAKFKGVVVGREAALKAKKRPHLVVLAEDLSDNSVKELGLFLESVPHTYRLFSKERWGEVFNRRPVGVIAVLDAGLARKLKGLLDKYTALYRRWE